VPVSDVFYFQDGNETLDILTVFMFTANEVCKSPNTRMSLKLTFLLKKLIGLFGSQ